MPVFFGFREATVVRPAAYHPLHGLLGSQGFDRTYAKYLKHLRYVCINRLASSFDAPRLTINRMTDSASIWVCAGSI